MFWENFLTLLLLFLPVQFGRHFWPEDSLVFGLRIDYLAPTIYCQDILILVLLVFWTAKNWRIFFNKRTFLLSVGFFLIAALNVVFALKPQVAFFGWLRTGEMIVLGVFIYHNALLTYRRLEKILPYLVIFEFILSIAQLIKQSSLGGIFWLFGERTFNVLTPGIARASFLSEVFLRPYGTFSHPNSLAGFILVCLVLIMGQGKLRFLEKLSVILGLFLLVLSFSRTVWLVLLLMGLVYLIIKFRKWLKRREFRLDFTYLTEMFSLILFGCLFSRTTIEESSFLGRIRLAEFAKSLIFSHPFLGVGANNFILALSRNFDIWSGFYWLQPVHNVFLLVGAETGLAGLGIFIILLFLVFKRLLSHHVAMSEKGRDGETRKHQLSLTVSLAVILSTGLFDHYWLTLIQNQLLFVFVLALSLSCGLSNDKIGLNEGKKRSVFLN